MERNIEKGTTDSTEKVDPPIENGQTHDYKLIEPTRLSSHTSDALLTRETPEALPTHEDWSGIEGSLP